MTTPHDDLEARVLAYEDLGPAERRRVDALLADDPAARAYVRAIRDAERRALTPGPLPRLDGARVADLTLEERARAEASLRALRRRPELSPPTDLDARPRGGRHRAWVPLVVALAALLLLVPRGVEQRDVLTSLSVVRDPLVTGTTRGAERAVMLTFDTAQPGYPVVVHLDASGAVARIFPAGDEPVRLDAGTSHRLPAAASETTWILDPEPGVFLLALGTADAPDLARLDDVLGRLPRGGGLDDRVVAVRDRMAEHVGPVRAVWVGQR